MTVKRCLSLVLVTMLTISLFGCGGYDLEDKALNASISVFGCKKDMTIKKAIKSSSLVDDYKFDYVSNKGDMHVFQIGISIKPKKIKRPNRDSEAKAFFIIKCESLVDRSTPVSEDIVLFGFSNIDGEKINYHRISPKLLFNMLTLDDEFDIAKFRIYATPY